MYNLRRKKIIRISVDNTSDQEQIWQLLNEKGEIAFTYLSSDSIATQKFVILNFVIVTNFIDSFQLSFWHRFITKHKRLSLILPLDAMSADDFRRLHIHLNKNPHKGRVFVDNNTVFRN